jgi:O-antigen/teichoic acid export membrane protein
MKASIKPGVVGTAVTLTQAISQFLVLAVLSTFYGLETVGNFSYVNAILLVVFMLFSFNLRNAYVLDSEKFGISSFYVVRIIGLLCAFVICYFAVRLTKPHLMALFYPLVLYRVIELFFELQWAHLQIQTSYFRILISQAGRYVVSSFCLVTMIVMNVDIQLTLWVYALSGLLFLSILEGKSIIRNIAKNRVNLRVWPCLKHCAPLGISLTAMSIQNNGVRFFLGLWSGNTVLGLFAIAYQIFIMPSMIFMAALNFYLKKASKEHLINKGLLIKLCVATVSLLVLAWFLLGEFFIRLFFGEPFLAIFVPCTYLLSCLIFKFLGYVYQWNMMNLGEYRLIAKHQIIVSVLITLSSAISIYLFGLMGSYIALAFSALIYFIYFFYLDRNVLIRPS